MIDNLTRSTKYKNNSSQQQKENYNNINTVGEKKVFHPLYFFCVSKSR